LEAGVDLKAGGNDFRDEGDGVKEKKDLNDCQKRRLKKKWRLEGVEHKEEGENLFRPKKGSILSEEGDRGKES